MVFIFIQKREEYRSDIHLTDSCLVVQQARLLGISWKHLYLISNRFKSYQRDSVSLRYYYLYKDKDLPLAEWEVINWDEL